MSLQQLSLGETISRSRTDVNLRRFGIQLLFNDSTIVGTGASPDNEGFFNTYMGWETAEDGIEGTHNTFMGYRAGRRTEVDRGVFLGSRSGEQLWFGSDDNVLIGFQSGFQLRGKQNVTLGNYTADSLTGSNNVIIGFSNSTDPTFVMDSVSIGAFSELHTVGDHQKNTSVGSYSRLLGEISDTINVGSSNTITEDGTNSIVIGNRTTNTGKRSTIIRPNELNSQFETFQNNQDDYLNIHDTLLGRRLTRDRDSDSQGEEETSVNDTTLRGEDVTLVSVPDEADIDEAIAKETNNHIRVSKNDVHIKAKRDVNIRGETFVEGNLTISDMFTVQGPFRAEGEMISKERFIGPSFFLSDTDPPRHLIEKWKDWNVKPVRNTVQKIDNFDVKDAAFVRIRDAIIMRFHFEFDFVMDDSRVSEPFLTKKERNIHDELYFSLPTEGRPSAQNAYAVPVRFYKHPGETLHITPTGMKVRFTTQGSCTGNTMVQFMEDEEAVFALKLDAFLPGKWSATGLLSYQHQPNFASSTAD